MGSIPTCGALEVWQWTFGSRTVWLVNKSAGQPQFYTRNTPMQRTLQARAHGVRAGPTSRAMRARHLPGHWRTARKQRVPAATMRRGLALQSRRRRSVGVAVSWCGPMAAARRVWVGWVWMGRNRNGGERAGRFCTPPPTLCNTPRRSCRRKTSLDSLDHSLVPTTHPTHVYLMPSPLHPY